MYKPSEHLIKKSKMNGRTSFFVISVIASFLTKLTRVKLLRIIKRLDLQEFQVVWSLYQRVKEKIIR